MNRTKDMSRKAEMDVVCPALAANIENLDGERMGGNLAAALTYGDSTRLRIKLRLLQAFDSLDPS
jgi:hypothetical protein